VNPESSSRCSGCATRTWTGARGEITIRKSGDGETTKSRRELVIPIARDLTPYLRAAIDSSDSVLVFPRPDGTMHSRNLHVNERIRTALKASGLPALRVQGPPHLERGDEVPGVRLRPLGLAGPEEHQDPQAPATGTLLSKAGVPIQIIRRCSGTPTSR
jgi:hypothetical protein